MILFATERREPEETKGELVKDTQKMEREASPSEDEGEGVEDIDEEEEDGVADGGQEEGDKSNKSGSEDEMKEDDESISSGDGPLKSVRKRRVRKD